jgi:hypothetical protein
MSVGLGCHSPPSPLRSASYCAYCCLYPRSLSSFRWSRRRRHERRPSRRLPDSERRGVELSGRPEPPSSTPWRLEVSRRPPRGTLRRAFRHAFRCLSAARCRHQPIGTLGSCEPATGASRRSLARSRSCSCASFGNRNVVIVLEPDTKPLPGPSFRRSHRHENPRARASCRVDASSNYKFA